MMAIGISMPYRAPRSASQDGKQRSQRPFLISMMILVTWMLDVCLPVIVAVVVVVVRASSSRSARH